MVERSTESPFRHQLFEITQTKGKSAVPPDIGMITWGWNFRFQNSGGRQDFIV